MLTAAIETYRHLEATEKELKANWTVSDVLLDGADEATEKELKAHSPQPEHVDGVTAPEATEKELKGCRAA